MRGLPEQSTGAHGDNVRLSEVMLDALKGQIPGVCGFASYACGLVELNQNRSPTESAHRYSDAVASLRVSAVCSAIDTTKNDRIAKPDMPGRSRVACSMSMPMPLPIT